MKNKLLILGLIFSVTVNIAVLSTIAYHRWGGCRGEGHSRIIKQHQESFLSRKLNLSQPQTEQMESFKESLANNMKKINTPLYEKRIQLINLLIEPKPDREKINLKLNEIASLQADLQRLTIDYLLKQKALFSPEQQEKFGSLIEERFYREVGHHKDGGLSAVAGEGCVCKEK